MVTDQRDLVTDQGHGPEPWSRTRVTQIGNRWAYTYNVFQLGQRVVLLGQVVHRLAVAFLLFVGGVGECSWGKSCIGWPSDPYRQKGPNWNLNGHNCDTSMG